MGNETSFYGKGPIQTRSTPSKGHADGTLIINGKVCKILNFFLFYVLTVSYIFDMSTAFF